MNIQVILKTAILTAGFVVLLRCHDLFVISLIRAHYLYDNLDAIPNIVLFDYAFQTLVLTIISLVFTGVVLGGGIVLWRRAERM